MSWRLSTISETSFITTKPINTVRIHLPQSLRKRRSSWTKRIIGGVALTVISVSLLASGRAEAISITFDKIVDTDTPIPGSTGNFDSGFVSDYIFTYFSLDDGDVAFWGESADTTQNGIYTYTDGKLNVVADTNTPIPGDVGNFRYFGGGLSLDNGNVAFSGYGREASGIYTYTDGKLNAVADNKNNPLIPTYYTLISPSLDNGNVAFLSNDFSDPDFEPNTIYTYIDGKLSVVADRSTPIPGGAEDFGAFYSPSLDNGNIVFEGDGPYDPTATEYDNGIYIYADGKLNVVADANTPIPGSTDDFYFFDRSSLDNENVAFIGENRYGDENGIYIYADGKLNTAADNNTPIPGGTGNFEFFYSPSLDNGNVAFIGQRINDLYLSDDNESGIYTNIGGKLAEVIAEGDLLDGKTVSSIYFGDESLSGKQIAFNANFEDGSEGIYVATVPEPASVLGTLAFGAFGAGWMLKRRQRKQIGLDKQSLPQSGR